MKSIMMKMKKVQVEMGVMLFVLGMMIPMVAHAQTVYVTRTGTKYHAKVCGRGNYSTTSLEDAISRGLEPCKKCFPNGAPSSTSKEKTSTKKKEKKPELNCSSKVMILKQTAKLKVKNYKGSIKWQTSNKKVVSVKKGTILARSKGKATVTAICGQYKKKCKVKVETPCLNYSNITMEVGEEYSGLCLSGCSHEAEWYCNNYDVLSVDEESIVALQPGSAIVTVKVHGKKFKCAVHVVPEDTTEDSYNYY